MINCKLFLFSSLEVFDMNKCDFCRNGPRSNQDICYAQGSQSCEEAAQRYMKVCMSRNHKTTTHNKNVNVHNTTHNERNGKKR